MARKLVFTILSFLIFLIVIESAARLFESYLKSPDGEEAIGPGWQAEFFGGILDWHENDPYLLWKFKANLNNPLIKTNSHHFLGPDFETEKPPETFRIMILGDSSPVGLGLKSRAETFDTKLRLMLQQEYAGVKNIEVINAAVSGYTSEQIKIFCEREAFKYEPDLIILYCGNNDASISGYYSDRELLESQQFQAIRKTLANLALYRLTEALLADRGKPESGWDLKIRVTPREYFENISRIEEICSYHNTPLIVLKPPVPYLWPAAVQFKPFLHTTGESGEYIFPEELSKFLNKKILYCTVNDSHKAENSRDAFTRAVIESIYDDGLESDSGIAYYESLLEENPNDPVLLNNLGVSYWKGDHYREASQYIDSALKVFEKSNRENQTCLTKSVRAIFQYNLFWPVEAVQSVSFMPGDPRMFTDTLLGGRPLLDSALQNDYLSLRIKREYWNALDNLKAKHNVTVVDLPLIFKMNGWENLFVDHCHPTTEGHSIIAKEIYETIKSRYAP